MGSVISLISLMESLELSFTVIQDTSSF